jgi:hypothetical protein
VVVLLLAASCLQMKGLTISNLIFDPDNPTETPTFDAPFFAGDGRTRLSGETFRVQIWTGATGPNEERPLTKPVGFKEGAGAGYFAIEEADILSVDQNGEVLPDDSDRTARWTDIENTDGLPVRLRVWERPSLSSGAEYGQALLRLEIDAHWNPIAEELTWSKDLSRTIGLGLQTYPRQNAMTHLTSLSNITLSRGGEHSVRLVDGRGSLGALELTGGSIYGSVSGLLWNSGESASPSLTPPGIPLPGEQIIVSAELKVAGAGDVSERFQWMFYQSTKTERRTMFRRGPLLEHAEMRFAAMIDANGDGKPDLIGSPREGGFNVWLQGEKREEFTDSRVMRGKRNSLPISVRECERFGRSEVWSVHSDFIAEVYLLNSAMNVNPEKTYELEEPPVPGGAEFRSSTTELVWATIETGCHEVGYLAGLVETTPLNQNREPLDDKMVQRLVVYELDTELKGGLERLHAWSSVLPVTGDGMNGIGTIVSLVWADIDPTNPGQELLTLDAGGTIHKWLVPSEEGAGRREGLKYEGVLSGVLSDAVDAMGQMLSVVDFNEDSHLDIVVVDKLGAEHVMKIYLSVGGGEWMPLESGGEDSFNLPESENLGPSFFLEDIDGDGDLDIWSSGEDLGPVIWFGSRNIGERLGFDFPVMLEPNGIPFLSTEELASMDLGILELEVNTESNGNGSLDVIVANESGIMIYEDLKVGNDSDERFEASFHTFPEDLRMDDFEFFVDQGNLRVAGVSATGMKVYKKFTLLRNLLEVSTSDYGGSVVRFADFDGDGTQDAAIGGSRSLKVLKGTGNGDFSFLGESAISVEPLDMVVGDFDLDGDFDLVLANRSEASTIWFNDGAGAMEFGGRLGGQEAIQAIALGNLFVEGDPVDSQVLDLWLVKTANGPSASGDRSDSNAIFEGLAGGQFDERTGRVDGTNQGNAVSLGDLDGDGDSDVWIVPGGVLLNEDGEFLLQPDSDVTEAGETVPTAIKLADFDGDGDLDAFITNNGQPNEVWLNVACEAQLNFTAADGTTWSRSVHCGKIESATSVEGPWIVLGVLDHGEALEIDVSERQRFFRSVP